MSRLDESQRQLNETILDNRKINESLVAFGRGEGFSHRYKSPSENITYASQVYPPPVNNELLTLPQTGSVLSLSRPATPPANDNSFDQFLDAYATYRQRIPPHQAAGSSNMIAATMVPCPNREPNQFEDFAAYIPDPYVPVWRWGLGFEEILRRNGYVRPFHPALLKGLMKPLLCLLYTSPSPRDKRQSRMPSSA